MSGHENAKEPANGFSVEPVLDACRLLIQNASAPHRLRDNSLAQTLLARATGGDPAQVLHDALERAVSRLDPRERAIVQRCYVDRELYAEVAKELGITQRHLYRERRRVLQKLKSLLLQPAPVAAIEQQDSRDELNRLVQTSRALEENGAIASAIDIIENQALVSTRASDRSRLLLRLAELHGRCGAFSKAIECLRGAIENAGNEPRTDPLLEAQASLTRAFIAYDCGKPIGDFRHDLDRTLHLVRVSGASPHDPAKANILAETSFLRVVTSAMSGNVTGVREGSSALNETLGSQERSNPKTEVYACFAQSLMNVYCEGDVRAAADYNWRAIDKADAAGLTLSSLELAINLAALYRLANQPARAAAILSDRLDTARAIAFPHVLAALLVELGAAFAEVGAPDRAHAALDEAAEMMSDRDALRAAYLRHAANVDLRAHEYRRSYESAASAEQTYLRLGKERLAASSMQLQAQALLSMGHRRPALNRLRGAIDILSSLHQRVALARAYRTLWHISGDTRHLDHAQRLAAPGEVAR